MMRFLEQLVSTLWNRLHGWRRKATVKESATGADLGFEVSDGEVTRHHIRLSVTRRTTHIAILGKTGSGKSSLIRYLIQQDVAAGRGFALIDIHGTMTPFALRVIALREWEQREHLHERLILIAPADREYSVGFNPLELPEPDFVRIAEFNEILRQRWGLDGFGARTEELLRNSLYVLSANGLTLLELAPLLTNTAFRAACLKRAPNMEVRSYFESRFGTASEAMRGVMREPILNKISAFTADPRFRHLVGQTHSTFNLAEAMDEGCFVLLDLPKGVLGEHALTLASLLFTVLRNATFSRRKHALFTIYCDEVHTLVSRSADLETMLSEARKFGVSVVTASQFLDQYPQTMRAAIQSVGTHIFFQLSTNDAPQIAQALDGGKPLAERLKNLPQRHFMVKSGAERTREAVVPGVDDPKANSTDLVARSRALRARPRAEVEQEIAKRHAGLHHKTDEALHAWE
jgi:hypothetical protein